MEFKYLYAFSVIGETGSFKEAIRILGISASQLSKNMNRLEEEMGKKLFTTSGRRMVLSQEGQQFLPIAKEIVKLQEEYIDRVRRFEQGSKGQLSIGLPAMSSAYNITTDIYSFQELHPEISINIIQENRSSALEYLLDIGRVDLIFTTNTECISNAKIGSQLYLRDYFKIVLPKDYPVNNSSLPISELKNEKFLMLPENTVQYKEVVRVCKDNGFVPLINGYFAQADMIMNLVRIGKGVSILMDKAMHRYINYLEIKVVDPKPLMPIDFYIVWNRNTNNRKSIDMFAKYIDSITAKTHT